MKYFFRNRAIKKYFRLLPSFLTFHWGKGGYSTGQVDRAIQDRGCSEKYKLFAYAMYCDESTFSNVSDLNYRATRTLVSDIVGVVHLLPDGNEFSRDTSYLGANVDGGFHFGGSGGDGGIGSD